MRCLNLDPIRINLNGLQVSEKVIRQYMMLYRGKGRQLPRIKTNFNIEMEKSGFGFIAELLLVCW